MVVVVVVVVVVVAVVVVVVVVVVVAGVLKYKKIDWFLFKLEKIFGIIHVSGLFPHNGHFQIIIKLSEAYPRRVPASPARKPTAATGRMFSGSWKSCLSSAISNDCWLIMRKNIFKWSAKKTVYLLILRKIKHALSVNFSISINLFILEAFYPVKSIVRPSI